MLFMARNGAHANPSLISATSTRSLNEKVRKGRREELSRLPGFDAEDLMDPTAKDTFSSGTLDWSQRETPEGRALLDFYRALLTLRRERIAPLLKGVGGGSGRFDAKARPCPSPGRSPAIVA